MDAICRNGHHSTDPDNCSECGEKIDEEASATTLEDPMSPASIADGLPGWYAVVWADASLYTEPNPKFELPVEPEQMYPLDLPETLIGRHSDRRDIHPEIDVNDPGVSHRHAKLMREPDGTITLIDIDSTNGTRLNDIDVEAGVPTPVTDGDNITMGYWTRVVIRGSPE